MSFNKKTIEDIDVSGNRGYADDVEFRSRERKHQSQSVIDSGIAVDNDSFLHCLLLFPAGFSPPCRADVPSQPPLPWSDGA